MAREFKTGVIIKGDARGAISATQATRNELDKLNTTVEKQTVIGKYASGGLATYAARFAGVAAVATSTVGIIGRFAKSVADNADRMRDLSIQTGRSTEFISGVGYAAELSGSSVEVLAAGLLKLNKNVAALREGTTKQVEVFGRLGLSYEALRQLSPEDQFLRIADRIKSIEDPILRGAAAADVFGKSAGPRLLPLLLEGSEGIAAMQAEAERLGLTISQEFADQADAFNDSLTTSQGVMTGIKNEIGEGLLPSLTALLQKFNEGSEATDTWQQVGEFFGNLVRVLVAGFITLREIVILTGETIWATGKVIVETLIAIAAPLLEFGNTLSKAFAALTSGDFAGAADAFTGLGERMKNAFVDNITVVGDTLKEFGQDASVRVKKAVEDVNDVLTRQAVIAPKAAAGVEELGEDTADAAKAAEEAAKQFESLLDRLDPLAKLSRQFSLDQAALVAKIAEGGDGVAYYTYLLGLLKEQYAEAARAAVGFGEDAIAAADKAAERTAAAAAREAAARAKALSKSQADLETFQTAFERGVERLDDLFADLWKGIFTGSKSILKSIKDFFLNWLAEMAHAAITRPIMVQLTTALVGGSTGTGAIAGSGGGFDYGGAINGIAGLFTGGGTGGTSNWAGMATNVAGMWGASGATAVGALGPNYGIATTAGLGGTSASSFAAAAIPIVGWVVAGILANKALFEAGWEPKNLDGTGRALAWMTTGGVSPIMEKLFSKIGLSDKWAGVLSGMAGLDFLFGFKNPKIKDQGIRGSYGFEGVEGEAWADIVAKGGIFRKDKKWTETDVISDEVTQFLGDIITSVSEFGQELADLAGVDISEALANTTFSFDLTLDADPEKAKEQITALGEEMGMNLIAAIAAEFGEGVKEFVATGDGLEEQIGLLTVAAKTVGLINAEIGLGERTFNDFLAVATSMKRAGEDLTTTFDRLFAEILTIVAQLDAIKGFAASDLEADYAAAKASQNQTLKEYTSSLADQIRELRAGYTGSAEDLAKLSTLTSQRYESEFAYLAQIDQVFAGITGGFQGLKDQINRDSMGDGAFYDQVTSQAEQLAATLKTMTDPAQIASTVAEIQRLAGIAYGLLDDEGKKSKGQGFLDFITGVEDEATTALTLARDLFVEESQVLRDLVTEMAEDFADPLEIAAAAHEGAAEALANAGQDLSDAANSLGNVAGQMVGAVRDGLGGIGIPLPLLDVPGSVPGAAVPYSTPATQAGPGLQQVADVLATTVINAIGLHGSASVDAIHKSVGGIKVNLQMPRGTMQTR